MRLPIEPSICAGDDTEMGGTEGMRSSTGGTLLALDDLPDVLRLRVFFLLRHGTQQQRSHTLRPTKEEHRGVKRWSVFAPVRAASAALQSTDHSFQNHNVENSGMPKQFPSIAQGE